MGVDSQIKKITPQSKTRKTEYMIQQFINKHFYNLFIFTYLIGLVLYGTIGFDSIDEICAMLLFLLFIFVTFKTPQWYVNKAFISVIGVFLFYLIYSIHINSNSKPAIVSDFIIQLKPYLAFFGVYFICPQFSDSQKKLLKSILYIIWAIMILIGGISIFYQGIFNHTVGHVAYYAAIITSTALVYLFCSNNTQKEKVIFLLILATGLLSARSKFYGFFVIAVASTLFTKFICNNIKFSFKTITLAILCITLMLAVSWQKMVMYFGIGGSIDSVSEDFIARAMLYKTSLDVFTDYFPFGSGFASFASFPSGVYYSKLYAKYDIDWVPGINKNDYSYIADTYYPCLAQFGIVGVFLFLLFFLYIFQKSLTLYKQSRQDKHFIIPFLIIGYFLIESIADATFTSHRGFFIMMLLGLSLSESKHYIRKTTIKHT